VCIGCGLHRALRKALLRVAWAVFCIIMLAAYTVRGLTLSTTLW
jgi:hypothetical protein